MHFGKIAWWYVKAEKSKTPVLQVEFTSSIVNGTKITIMADTQSLPSEAVVKLERVM